jgi:hypothetical protein
MPHIFATRKDRYKVFENQVKAVAKRGASNLHLNWSSLQMSQRMLFFPTSRRHRATTKLMGNLAGLDKISREGQSGGNFKIGIVSVEE